MNAELIELGTNKELAIVAFSGHGGAFATPTFEFVKFLKTHYPDADKYFYADKFHSWYHKGIKGLTEDIDETVDYLRERVANYKKVLLVGVSAGGYAAILFGSLLEVDCVISFIPQTIISEEPYSDLALYINDSTQFYLFCSLNDPSHDLVHCQNIIHLDNVHLNVVNKLDMKQLRDSGELLNIFNTVLQ